MWARITRLRARALPRRLARSSGWVGPGWAVTTTTSRARREVLEFSGARQHVGGLEHGQASEKPQEKHHGRLDAQLDLRRNGNPARRRGQRRVRR